MADEKMITQFDAATTLADTDIMPCVDGIGGTPATKKITVLNLKTLFAGLTTAYVDRGDPAADDFTISSFTRDSTWRDLDLSSIVPAGAKAVALRIAYRNTTAGPDASFRKKGNSNAINMSTILCTVANQAASADLAVLCNTNRFIQYYFYNSGTWNIANVTVKGWWL